MCTLAVPTLFLLNRRVLRKQFMRLRRPLCSALLVLAALTSEISIAGEALMLPAGIYRIRYYFTHAKADSVFDAEGTKRPFSDLYRQALVDNGVPVDGGDAYRIDTDGIFRLRRQDLYLEYGVTDNFGFGAWLQYFDITNDARATLVTESAWNSFPGMQQQAILIGVNAIDGLDSSAAAVGDTVIGLKHRLMGSNTSIYRFAYNLGVRVPTGHVADPLLPRDLSTGDGQYDVGIWLSFDYQPHSNFTINLQTRHEYQFAGKRQVLDPSDPARSLEMEFQPGAYNQVEIEATYAHPIGNVDLVFKLLTTYFTESNERRQAFDADRGEFSGSPVKVPETRSSLWSIQPHIGFSLFPRKIPVRSYLSYGLPLKGRNMPEAKFWQLRMDLYF